MCGLARSSWSAALISASFSSIIRTRPLSCSARHSAERVRPAAKLARSSRTVSSAIPSDLPGPGNRAAQRQEGNRMGEGSPVAVGATLRWRRYIWSTRTHTRAHRVDIPRDGIGLDCWFGLKVLSRLRGRQQSLVEAGLCRGRGEDNCQEGEDRRDEKRRGGSIKKKNLIFFGLLH